MKAKNLKVKVSDEQKEVIEAVASVEGYFRYYIKLRQRYPLETDQNLWELIEGRLGLYNAKRYQQFTSFSSAKNRFIKTNRAALKDLFVK
jgi:hypothetical protein